MKGNRVKMSNFDGIEGTKRRSKKLSQNFQRVNDTDGDSAKLKKIGFPLSKFIVNRKEKRKMFLFSELMVYLNLFINFFLY